MRLKAFAKTDEIAYDATVAIAAPMPAYRGIRKKLIRTLKIAPASVL
jgi:hypothetical protein